MLNAKKYKPLADFIIVGQTSVTCTVVAAMHFHAVKQLTIPRGDVLVGEPDDSGATLFVTRRIATVTGKFMIKRLDTQDGGVTGPRHTSPGERGANCFLPLKFRRTGYMH